MIRSGVSTRSAYSTGELARYSSLGIPEVAPYSALPYFILRPGGVAGAPADTTKGGCHIRTGAPEPRRKHVGAGHEIGGLVSPRSGRRYPRGSLSMLGYFLQSSSTPGAYKIIGAFSRHSGCVFDVGHKHHITSAHIEREFIQLHEGSMS